MSDTIKAYADFISKQIGDISEHIGSGNSPTPKKPKKEPHTNIPVTKSPKKDYGSVDHDLSTKTQTHTAPANKTPSKTPMREPTKFPPGSKVTPSFSAKGNRDNRLIYVKNEAIEFSQEEIDAFEAIVNEAAKKDGVVSETSDHVTINNSEQDDINSLVEEFIEEMKTAKNTMITLGGKQHPMNKIPMEHYAEFKKKYPGVRTRFRGKREKVGQLQARSGGEKGKENFIHRVHSGDRSGVSVSDTLKKDATHFYAHPSDVEAAGHKLS